MAAPIFVRTTEGGVEVITPWPDETLATREFIEQADAQFLERRGRTLRFTLTNGSAVYRMASRDKHWDTYLLKRVR